MPRYIPLIFSIFAYIRLDTRKHIAFVIIVKMFDMLSLISVFDKIKEKIKSNINDIKSPIPHEIKNFFKWEKP